MYSTPWPDPAELFLCSEEVHVPDLCHDVFFDQVWLRLQESTLTRVMFLTFGNVEMCSLQFPEFPSWYACQG